MTEAIVLAGGLGTRLKEKTRNTPKPMIAIGGRPFLELVLDHWIAQGVQKFILSVGYKHEVVQAHFGSEYQGAKIEYSVEKKPLGTGGGLLLAAKRLSVPEPFLALNGDTFFEVKLDELKKFHAAHDAACTIALFEVTDRDRYEGVQMNGKEKIEAFLARGEQGECCHANGGVYLLDHDWARDYPNTQGAALSIEKDIFPDLVKRKKELYGFISKGRFIDIGTPSDLARCEAMLTRDGK